MDAQDMTRQPCPDRILEDIGTAFGMGAVGGSVFYFIKGLRSSPNGHRLAGGATAVRMHAPRVGGGFAVWGGLICTFDCAMIYARKKEDPWNSIAAGAATGGLLSLRQGLRAAGRSAIMGAAVLALIEGAGIMASRFMAAAPPPEDIVLQYPAQHPAGQHQAPAFLGIPPAPPIVVQEIRVPPGWFAGLFGRKQ